MVNQSVDLYVLGGGIVGLCSAVQLQAQGVRVAIIDANAIGQGASFGNAGHLAVEQVFPFADPSIIYQLPSMLLNPLGPITLNWRYLPTLMPWAIKLLLNMRQHRFSQIHQALKNLNGISLSLWQNFAKKWQLNEYVHVQGSLLTAETSKTLLALQTHHQKMMRVGIPTQWLDKKSLHQLEPNLSDNQLAAIFFPQTGHVSNLVQVHKKLIEQFVQMGGVIQEYCQVIDLYHQQDGIELITNQGNVMANNIMISMGAFSKELVKKATGVVVPLDTERGYHLMLPKEQSRLSIPVTSLDRRFIMTPMQAGLRLAGTAEYAGLTAPANMQRATMLKQLANPMFKLPLDATDATTWMGFRPSTADSLPVIDKIGRVLLNFGHQHLGLTQAVSSAELISHLYFDTPTSIDISPFRLSRFGNVTPQLLQS